MDYNLNLIIQGIMSISRMLFDILIVWFVLYYAIKIIRNNSRTVQIFKGVVVVLLVETVSKVFGLTAVQFIASMFVNWGFLVIVIIFQPEIRNILEKLGKSNVFSSTSTLSGNEKERLITELSKACIKLSSDNTGAIISIEQGQSLLDYIKTGVELNSTVTSELLISLFVTSTPLHDGAVILKGDKIACASAYFPPTNLKLSSKYGARHRAAIGISEISDCITLVVSEETGDISIAQNGNLQLINKDDLEITLSRLLYNSETEVKSKKHQDNNIYVLKKPLIEVEVSGDNEKVKVYEKKLDKTSENVSSEDEVVLITPVKKENKSKIKEKKSLFNFNSKRKKVVTEKIDDDRKDEIIDVIEKDIDYDHSSDDDIIMDSLATDSDFESIISSLETEENLDNSTSYSSDDKKEVK